MSYKISEILRESGLGIENCKFIDEEPFEVFSRITNNQTKATCVFVCEMKYIKNIYKQDNIRMIITTSDIASQIKECSKGICICDNPKALYFILLDYVNTKHDQNNCQETVIGRECKISKQAHIFENDVVIEDNVIIEDFAIIYPHTHIGKGSIIRSGSQIGIQDYNYYFDSGIPKHIYHGGGVKIGNDTEIGPNACVGRALYMDSLTVIGDNCKLGTNSGVGHDSRIGNCVMIYSGSILGGNVIVEDDVHITLNCTIKNGVRIGKGAMVCMGSTVMTNVRDGIKVWGNPARKMDL